MGLMPATLAWRVLVRCHFLLEAPCPPCDPSTLLGPLSAPIRPLAYKFDSPPILGIHAIWGPLWFFPLSLRVTQWAPPSRRLHPRKVSFNRSQLLEPTAASIFPAICALILARRALSLGLTRPFSCGPKPFSSAVHPFQTMVGPTTTWSTPPTFSQLSPLPAALSLNHA